MPGGIGATLREARKRRKVELSEVEAATKIRAGFLRAIEAEDWDALPGDAYARGFVRTYAGFLGLDGARLAEGVPRSQAPPSPVARGRGVGRRTAAVGVCVALLGAIGLIGYAWSGGGDEGGGAASGENGASTFHSPGGGSNVETPPERGAAVTTGAGSAGAMELSLTTTAELWVCLLDEEGSPLVDGLVLPSGAEEGPFRSGSFTVSFGNGEVEMRIDGRDTDIPESASPLGYEIGQGGELAPLGEAERPTCT